MKKNFLRLAIVVLVLLIVGVLWLNNDINQKKKTRQTKMPLLQMRIFLYLAMIIQILKDGERFFQSNLKCI